MTGEPLPEPLPLTELIAYLAGELDDRREARIEEHYFECETCARRLEWLQELGAAVVELVRDGAVSASVMEPTVERARDLGLQLRTYRITPGSGVQCTATPDDDFVVVRLSAELADDEQADLAAEIELLESGERQSQHLQAVCVDRERGELILMFAGERVRALPRSRWTLHVQARGTGGQRSIGPYTMDHTPHAATGD